MGFLTGRMAGIAGTAAVVLAGLVVAGVIWTRSGDASGVELTSARLVPADSTVYFALNTDLKSEQWVSAFDLLVRMGEEDPEGELRESAEEDGALDWENDVAPFLGGNAAFFMRSVAGEMGIPEGGVIFKANDAERAIEVYEEQAGAELAAQDSDGVTYFADEMNATWLANIDGHLVLTSDEPSMLAVIDVYHGDDQALSEVAEFVQLRDELSNNFLGFLYVDTEALLGDFMGADSALEAFFDEAGADAVMEPFAGVVGAESEGFTFQAAGMGDPGPGEPMVQPRVSRFASMVPAETAFFFASYGLGDAMSQALDDAEAQLDDAVFDTTGYQSFDEAFAEAGGAFGLESIDEVFDFFRGETAVTIWWPTGDEDAAEGALLTEVADADAARDTLERLLAQYIVNEQDVNGTTITIADDGEDQFAYAFLGNDLVFGTLPAVEAVVAAPADTLADDGRYIEAIDVLPTETGTFGYFDMKTLLRLTSGGIPADLDQAEEALEAVIFNMVQERGIIRVSGAMTVEDE